MRCRAGFLVGLLFWLFAGQPGRAQTGGATDKSTGLFRVDHIGVNDGLTQGSVYSMLKDSRNFLWFGTQDGLNRYDGHRFRTYQPVQNGAGQHQPGSIHGINILGLVEEPSGNLWVGTEEGLNRYDRQRDRFDFFAVRGSARHPQLSRALPFYVDSTELLYLSDADGLVQLDLKTRHKTILTKGVYPSKEYDLPSSAVRSATGDVWLHAPRGLIQYNLRRRSLTHYFSDQPMNRLGSAQVIFSFYVDNDSIAWLGTSNGLIRLNYRQPSFQTFRQLDGKPISSIYSIAGDSKGRLWLGTRQDGVLYFDKQTQQFNTINDFANDSRHLSEFEIHKLYVDNLGIGWANADPDGLARIVPDALLFGGFNKRQLADNLQPDQKLSSYTVRGFMEERPDRLWIATPNGIDVFNPRQNRIVQRYLTKPNAPNYAVKSLYRDPQGRIWVGTVGGVLAFEPNKQTFEPIRFPATSSQVTNNYVRNLISLNDSLLVAATEDGLYALQPNQRRLTKLPALAGHNIFSLWYNAALRQLWVGTYIDGYYCYQLPKQPLDRWHKIRSGLPGSMVLHIRPDSARRLLWLATDRGLAALNPKNGRFWLYTDRQGLANSFVYGSVPDDQNNLWISTNRGISRLDRRHAHLKNFSLSDGLQGYEFNGNAYLRTSTGELYFGGVNGFNRFRPEWYKPSSFNPPVHIYSLVVNDEPFASDTYVGEASTVTLSHAQNTISMEFAAFDYAGNGRNNYQYQLVNYDPQWVSAGERNYVRYANLPAGHYVFRVKATNQDGHWSNRIRQLTIQIEPPFWQTKSFLILSVLALFLLVYAWIRGREKVIRQQETERLRLAYDIQEQVKKDIARDLHDEIGTRLATLKLYTTRLLQLVAVSPLEATSPVDTSDSSDANVLKTNIFNLINSTIGDVRNLLRKLNPQTLERYGYVAAIEELFTRINGTNTISLQLHLSNAPGDESTDTQKARPRLPATTEVMLYRISQELINNSLKHANARHINLYVEGQSNRLLLTYTDDGQGFDFAQTSRTATGLGIGSIESRVAILHGRINWQTQPGQGVRVVIDIPMPLGQRA